VPSNRRLPEDGVWKAFDAELERVVAVKIPKPSRLARNDAFLHEARRVARLRHPAIVPVYDVGTDGDHCFIVSEHMDGGSLAGRLAAGPLEASQALRWTAQIADALDFAHRQGVIHRDVKPPNILINHHGDAVLADFGIAQSASKRGEFAPSVGTLHYMAPEQLAGGPVGPAADIYSLGIVLHEAATGRTPHAGAGPAEVRQQLNGNGEIPLDPAVPEPIAAICRRAVRQAPQRRYANAAAFAADLRTAAMNTAGHRPGRGFLATNVGILAAALGAVAIAAAFLLPFSRRPADGLHSPPAGSAPPQIVAGPSGDAAVLFDSVVDSLPYVVASRNIRLYREWQEPPLVYLGPAKNDELAFVTFRFDCAAKVSRARLLASSFCTDFLRIPHGRGRGTSAIDVSTDGVNWHVLRDNIGPAVWGEEWSVNEDLPPSVTSGSSLWVRVRLLSHDAPNTAYTTAQFARDPVDASAGQTRFGVVFTFDVPD